MLMFNGFAQVRKTCNTDHPLQYSVNDNYLQAQINTTSNIHVFTTLSAAQPNLITKKEHFFLPGVCETSDRLDQKTRLSQTDCADT